MKNIFAHQSQIEQVIDEGLHELTLIENQVTVLDHLRQVVWREGLLLYHFDYLLEEEYDSKKWSP